MNDVELLSQAEHNTSHDEFQFTAKVTQKKNTTRAYFYSYSRKKAPLAYGSVQRSYILNNTEARKLYQ